VAKEERKKRNISTFLRKGGKDLGEKGGENKEGKNVEG